MIIVGFVAGKSDEHISSELISQMLVIGLGLDEAWLAEFINGKRRVFKAEIRAMKYAHTMLELQDSPAEVLSQVTKMLNEPEQYKLTDADQQDRVRTSHKVSRPLTRDV
ncbi:MAG: hypothetical protein EOM03_17585 [Clostridia bacterium]|nr:hypothetical protein [Clostridia bacterium]